ncbi:MAG: ferrous iron transporter B [Myxococcota bacterium]
MSEAVLDSPLRLGLLGSPNSGKTTLFNSLTGLRAKVSNYPGVTVERREGQLVIEGRRAVIVDLPGTYSLTPTSPDEQVVTDVLDGELPGTPEALVVVADACSLERSLLFVAQVLQRDIPICLVLTMTDELHARGGVLDLPRLERALGVPVRGVVGHKGLGLSDLRHLLARPESWGRPHLRPPRADSERGSWVESILASVLTRRPGAHRLTEAIDRVVLHPVAGSALFAAIMVAFFQLIFVWATPAMNLIDASVASAAAAVHTHLPPGLAADFIADGLIAGVGAVLIFLPQILMLFCVLFILEDLGYMARAAFLIDRVMGRFGLEGRCFVSLLSSYACAVPGIMATRTIPSSRNRLVTMLVAPLMTCSARLPVYTLLIGAFVPATTVGFLGLQGLVLLGLYSLGMASALAVAILLKLTLIPGESSPFYMELPPYRMPTVRLLTSQVWGAASAFVKRAGTIILAVSIVMWVLLTFPRVEPSPEQTPTQMKQFGLEHSFAGRAGHALEPLIAPLGFDWKIGVGLLASLAAREVIVATLAQIYVSGDPGTSLREAIRADRDPDTGRPVFGPATVASLLVFFVFALQCMSTLAILRRESNSWRWPAFAFSYMLSLAYAASFVTYRLVSALTPAG